MVNSDSNAKESVHLCDFPEPVDDWINQELIINVDSLKKFVELGRSARSKSKVKIRQPLGKVSFAIEDNKVADFFIQNSDIILEELNVKSVERLTDTDQLITYKIKPNLRTLGQKYGKGLAEIRNLLEKEDSSMLVSQLQSSGSPQPE